MNKIQRFCFKLSTCLWLLHFSINAQANSIYLTPDLPSVSNGSQVSLNIMYNFTDQSLGGGFDVWFGNYSDPLNPTNTFTNGNGLSFISFTPNAAFGAGDPGFFSFAPTLLNTHLDSIAFGSLNGLPTVGVGPERIGTLLFSANQVGSYYLTLADNSNSGGFVDNSGVQLNYSYTGAVVQVTPGVNPPPVPISAPGTAVLVFTGLAGLLTNRRRAAA